MEKKSVLVHFGSRTKVVNISFEAGRAELTVVEEAVRQSFNIPTSAHLVLQVSFCFVYWVLCSSLNETFYWQ